MIGLYETVMKSHNIFFLYFLLNKYGNKQHVLSDKKAAMYVLPINLLNTKGFFSSPRLGSPSPRLPLQWQWSQGEETWTLGVFTCHDLNFNEITVPQFHSKHRQTDLLQTTQQNNNVWRDLELQRYMSIVEIIIDSGKQKM